MNFRRVAKDNYLDGVEVGSLRGLFKTMDETDIWLNMGL